MTAWIDSKLYRMRAAECLRLIAFTYDAKVKENYARMARHYEALAKQAEQVEQKSEAA